MSDLRAVLEGIAYGEDDRITPGDRLRAVEGLRDLQPAPSMTELEREVASWSQEHLDREWDDLCAAQFVTDLKTNTGRYPKLQRLIGEWVEERARELADRDTIEREIEERAVQKSLWLFERELASKPLEDLYANEDDTHPVTPSTPAEARTTRLEAIPPPPGVDLNAGFRRRNNRRRLGGV